MSYTQKIVYFNNKVENNYNTLNLNPFYSLKYWKTNSHTKIFVEKKGIIKYWRAGIIYYVNRFMLYVHFNSLACVSIIVIRDAVKLDLYGSTNTLLIV